MLGSLIDALRARLGLRRKLDGFDVYGPYAQQAPWLQGPRLGPGRSRWSEFCDGQFDRLIDGFTPAPGEIDGLYAAPGMADALLERFDPADPEHGIAAAFVHLLRDPPASARARAAFAAVARGEPDSYIGRLAALYLAWLDASSPAERVAALEPRLEHRIPASYGLFAQALLAQAEATGDRRKFASLVRRARKSLRIAIDLRDRQAMVDLARLGEDGKLHTQSARMDRELLISAAAKEHTPAYLHLAMAAKEHGDLEGAYAWATMGAQEEPRFFRNHVIAACRMAGELIDRHKAALEPQLPLAPPDFDGDPDTYDGPPYDWARHWYRTAADLGDEQAGQQLKN